MAVVTLRRGDVLSLPTGDGRLVLGQVLEDPTVGSFLLAVFDTVFAEGAELVPVAKITAGDEIRLMAPTNQVFVELGRWQVVGRAPVRKGLPMPAYKVAIDRPDNVYIEDWNASRRRPARPDEIEKLPQRAYFSPAAVARAIRASLDLEPWLESGKLMRPGGMTTQEAFGAS